VTSVTETTTVYNPATGLSSNEFKQLGFTAFPNPSNDIIAIQVGDLVKDDLLVELFDLTGKLVAKTQINKGSTVAYFDAQTLYNGTYMVVISNGNHHFTQKIVINKN